MYEKIRLMELKTGYGFLVSNATELGKAITEVELLTNSQEEAQWNHAGGVKKLLDSARAIEMEPNGLEDNDLRKYASTKTLIAIPKFPYSEDLCEKFMLNNIGKKRYNFLELVFILVKGLSFKIIDLTLIYSKSDICSEAYLEMMNYASAGEIPKWKGKKPADIAAMTDKFNFKILIYA